MYDIEQKSAIFKAMSDVNRLKIIEMLSCGEMCACKILAHFKITQPTLSHHMKVLLECGLVTARKDGVWMHYCLNTEEVADLVGFVNSLTNGKADCFNDVISDCCNENMQKGVPPDGETNMQLQLNDGK